MWRKRAAATRRPPASMRRMISPMRLWRTASGLTIASVRSVMLPSSARRPLSRTERGGHRAAELGGALCDAHACGFERADLVGRRAAPDGDDGAGVAHPLPLRRRLPGNEHGDRLRHRRRDERRRLLFGGAADLADQDHARGARIVLVQAQHVDEAGADDRIAADADARRLADTELRQLVHRFVSQRAAARDDADRPRLVDVAGHDADLALARGDHARAVRTDEARLLAFQVARDAYHIERRHAFGDADRERQLGVGGFHDRVGGERRRHEDARDRRAGRAHRLLDGVEDGNALEIGAALSRRHTADDLGAVLATRLRVELPSGARDPLDDDARVLVDEDTHRLPPAAATARRAPSAMSAAVWMARPDSARICLPRSTFVPSMRTTSGTFRPTSRAACTTPSASTSQRRMPPKMLMKIARTLASERRMRNASRTFAASAPPPTSRKLAGSPPAYFTISIVAIASPAPFTMQPMLPLRAM